MSYGTHYARAEIMKLAYFNQVNYDLFFCNGGRRDRTQRIISFFLSLFSSFLFLFIHFTNVFLWDSLSDVFTFCSFFFTSFYHLPSLSLSSFTHSMYTNKTVTCFIELDSCYTIFANILAKVCEKMALSVHPTSRNKNFTDLLLG